MAHTILIAAVCIGVMRVIMSATFANNLDGSEPATAQKAFLVLVGVIVVIALVSALRIFKKQFRSKKAASTRSLHASS